MSEAAAATRGPGRPASGAQERILEAAFDILGRDGYAGLTTAKVAAASGQNKALIPYYFGSKQGLIAAVARRVSAEIIDEVLGGLGDPVEPLALVQGLADGVWRVMDSDERLLRVYFDLASQSVVEERVSEILLEMKEGQRAVLRELLRGLERPPASGAIDGIVVFLVAGLEGLALERIERGETPALRRARKLFVSAGAASIDAA